MRLDHAPRLSGSQQPDDRHRSICANGPRVASRLSLPTIPEQRRIAAILDTVDDAIRSTEGLIAKLEQVKQGLLHDLLTRGIDENGELRDPDRHPEQFTRLPLGPDPERGSGSDRRPWPATDYEAGSIAFKRERIGSRLPVRVIHTRADWRTPCRQRTSTLRATAASSGRLAERGQVMLAEAI